MQVVITGGNNGIGQSIADEFNKHGAKIAIFARNKDNRKSSAPSATP